MNVDDCKLDFFRAKINLLPKGYSEYYDVECGSYKSDVCCET